MATIKIENLNKIYENGFPAVVVCGRDGFHSGVEPEYEVSEVQSQTDAVAYGDLFVETVEAELSSRLALVVAHGPDVSGIDKCAEFEHPKEFGAILQIEVEANIAALIDEAVDGVGGEVAAGT